MCTSLKLFKCIPLSILSFGFEVLFPSMSEIRMLDRCQLAILRIILGLPVRAPSIAIHHLTGTLPFKSRIYGAHMSFLYRVLSLPEDSVSRAVFIWRYDSHPASGFCHHVFNILEELDLPHPADLLQLGLPSKQVWKAHVKSLLYLQAHDHLISSVCNMVTLSNFYDVSPNLKGKPSCIINLFKGDVSLARLHQFRLRLLLHCSELNADTVSFWSNCNNRVRSSICSLCSLEPENAFHFLVSCVPLQPTRSIWFPSLDPASSQVIFNHIMGVVWIPQESYQKYLTQFVAALRVARLALPI